MIQGIRVDLAFNPCINFAMQQNYVPIVRNIIIHNDTEDDLEDICVKINFEPQYAEEFSDCIARVESGGSVMISPVNIHLKTEYLFSLTEKLVGTLRLALFQKEQKIYEVVHESELLAYDQWSGLGVMPEIIAAYVTPNHPAVSGVISEAAKYLEQWDKTPKFTGYQTQEPKRVKIQMAAIYAALKSLRIVYNNPPASYEMMGQRIRTAGTVLEQKQGTCLDMALLYAACLEAVALHPIVVFQKQHAFVGCWLYDESFSDCVSDDITALKKRLVAGAEEMLLLEATNCSASSKVDFEGALSNGLNHLKSEGDFELWIDVQRSRNGGIRPIPTTLEKAVETGGGNKSDFLDESELSFDKRYAKKPTELYVDESLGRAYSTQSGGISLADGENGTPMSAKEQKNLPKQRVWERNLLDLSLRNALLNFRVTKKSLQVMVSDLEYLEDELSIGSDFVLKEVPSEWRFTMRDSKIYQLKNDAEMVDKIAGEELKNKRIRTFLTSEELKDSAKNIYRSAKTSMEENGANTLFLALGFLRWYESELSEKARYAPIVLLPIDMVKSTKNRGYVIRSRQEGAQINITLMEYLKQEFGIKIEGLDPLPEDENGINLALVYHIVRQAIMNQKRWDIEEMAFVGLFSFGQFIMWNDIRNRSDDLRRNKIVSSLMDGKLNFEIEPNPLTVERLDKEIEHDKMAVPMKADSSQLLAVASAARGNSFVLHGAPGTGKSQTITNMIANALYQGKSVLFVASKMAALSVVQKRLESIGLEPFCLELHSNKTNKNSVLHQLERALEVGRVKPPADYQATVQKLEESKKTLNEVMEAIHAKREFGASLYDAIDWYVENKNEKGKIDLPDGVIQKASEVEIPKWFDALREFGVAIAEVGEFKTSPLKYYKGLNYSMDLRDNLEKLLKNTVDLSNEATKAVNALRSEIPSGFDVVNFDASSDIAHPVVGSNGALDNAEFGGSDSANTKLVVSREMVEHFVAIRELRKKNFSDATTANDVPVFDKMILSSGFEGLAEELSQVIQSGKDYNAMRSDVLKVLDESALDYDVDSAILNYKKVNDSWFVSKYFGRKKLIKEMNLYATKGVAINSQNISKYHQKLSEIGKLKERVLNMPEALKNTVADYYLEMNTDWSLLEAGLQKARAVHSLVKQVNGAKREAYVSLIYSDEGAVDTCLEKISEFMVLVRELETDYVQLSELDSEDWITSVASYLDGLRANLSGLKEWIVMLQKANALSEYGLDSVIDAWKKGTINEDNIDGAFKASLYYGLLIQTIHDDERLISFHGAQYENVIARFGEFIDTYRRVIIQELVAKLSAQVPVAGIGGATSSEISILNRAIKSKGRMMSIRKLFSEIPTLIRRICPCMLMSPISVAQYIDVSFPKFDLVIFDEASQIPTSEAIGAMARGENVVITGDPNQLPPTTFFHSNRIDEEHMEQEDLESLLDDCLALGVPREYLKWHYRSRHESLIAFSNMNYYDNRLFTFPSPNDLVSEVKFVLIEGFYDKGKTKQNRAEAQAIVAEIIRRLSDPVLREDSIGVVTFSSVQQILIDDMLSEALVDYPELEEFDRNREEPLFIKNLENVQGDERDIILFSVGYGPTKDGKVSMNFGPLNREGGWRRLNVAISRSRKGMIVYSTLRPEQIDLSRTRAEGVAGLKGFLEYAQRGKSALSTKTNSVMVQKDDIAEKIAADIRKMGYDVACNIGCSGYRMDMGVIDPELSDTYLLGILLDGKNCSKAATARDRFVVQPGVLKGLGWKIMRVWTLEWLDNPEKILALIKDEIEKVQQEKLAEKDKNDSGSVSGSNSESIAKVASSSGKRLYKNMSGADGQGTEVGESEEVGKSAEASKSAGGVGISSATSLNMLDGKTLDGKKKSTISREVHNEPKRGKFDFERMSVDEIRSEISRAQQYRTCHKKYGDADDFYKTSAQKRIAQTILGILEMEAPICRELLCKRVLSLWGISRSSSKSVSAIEGILAVVQKGETAERDRIFYWNPNQNPEDYAVYRIEQEDDKRSIDEISAYEISNAILEVLLEQISLTKKDLIRETAKKFGFTRLGSVIEESVGYAIESAISRGVITLQENGRIMIA